MEEQKACALSRAREKQQKKDTIKQKTFFDYDWKKLQKNGKLHFPTKSELQHYLKHYKLSCNGRKDDWVQRISSHLLLSGVDQAMRCGNIHSNTNCKIWQKCDWRFISWWWLKWRQWRRGCEQFGRWGPTVAAGPWSEEEEEFIIIPETVIRGPVEWLAVLQLLLSTR